jgi:hypothetical protein
LSLASLSCIVLCLWIRSWAYPRVEHLKGASLGYAPALPTNIRLGWNGLPGTNTLAYYGKAQLTAVKSFITLTPTEHGHAGIVKYLLQNPDTDVLAKDNDGLTALAVAMEAGHRDLGVLLYANTSLSRGASPYSSVRSRRPQSSSTSHSRTASPSTSRCQCYKTFLSVNYGFL